MKGGVVKNPIERVTKKGKNRVTKMYAMAIPL